MDRAGLLPLLSAERIAARVGELGATIDADFPDAGRPLWLVGALKGAAFFLADLARAIRRDVRLDFVRASSYGASTESSGTVRLLLDLSADVAGCDVILAEDIVDSGRTANALVRLLQSRNAASVTIAALLDKPSRRVEPVEIRYRGFEIEDRFVVGYGLDAAESYRNLPGVWTLGA
ncbi:MAG: hypoxanthine phosphoribosyltransferase [Acidobacteria bacterium]|nr:hypoxanthine phosphoribosyltransferase [Acidobacteriota bacterium]